MTSEARSEANRRNALKSTGPRTSAGKSVVARNAVKHGLLSREVVLPQEDRAAFRAFAVNLCEELQPEGALEILLADRIIAAAWRLRRIQVIETDLCAPERLEYNSWGTRFIQNGYHGDALTKLSRYEAGLDRIFYRALRELERLQIKRTGGNSTKPRNLNLYIPPGQC